MTHDARTLDPDILSRWIGRSETRTDRIDPGPAQRMQLTLDRAPTLTAGDPLPPLWHWFYFLTAAPISALGRDGHTALGTFIPPVALERRMWAGGRVTFHAPLLIGSEAKKTSTVKDVRVKTGRSGTLCFVTVRHEVLCEGTPALTEEHDIVYRGDPAPGAAPAAPPSPPEGGAWARRIEPSPVVLFRYSALTFNGHRIHYDRDYCRDVEGYPGLVVHGPLTATLLADLAVETAGTLTGFDYRATAPVFDDAPFMLRGKAVADGAELWAETPAGGLAMHATARTC